MTHFNMRSFFSLYEKKREEGGRHDCREPAWGILPMAKVMRKRPDGQRRDQDSRDPLDLLEHLPPNQNLSYYFVPFTNSPDIQGAIPDHLSLEKINLGL